jgi:hypothetical protein
LTHVFVFGNILILPSGIGELHFIQSITYFLMLPFMKSFCFLMA